MDVAKGDFPELPLGIRNTTVITPFDLLRKSIRLARSGYDVNDFQYFVGPKGVISIIDPGGLRTINELRMLTNNPFRFIPNTVRHSLGIFNTLLWQGFKNLF